MPDIAQSLHKVHQRIATAAQQAGRSTDDIQLLAVSKTKPAQMVRAAYQAGQTSFGENYLQDALDKINALRDLPIEWHYIGRLQSNKCKEIARYFSWVHGIDQLKHARLLSANRPDEQAPLQVCIQVNLSGEASKNGIAADQLAELAQAISPLPRLQLRGLMTMPGPNSTGQEQAAVFQQLARLKDQLNQQGLRLDTLSMGMSGDLESAITAGSTLVRVGSDIFGARN